MAVVDPTVSLSSLLQDAGMTRIHITTLARSEASVMPRINTVIRWAGGFNIIAGRSYLPLAQRRLQVRCYGAVDSEARAQLQVAYEALKYFMPHVRQGVYLRSADPASEPITGVEQDTDWPFALQMFSVIYDERAPS